MSLPPDDLTFSAWSEALRAAHTEAEVVTAVRRFMFCVPPEDLQRLPPECREVSITNAATLCQWAVVLRQAELFTGPHLADAGLLQRMSAVLTLATTRLAAIASGRTIGVA